MTHAVHPAQFHPHTHPNQVRTASGLNFLAAIYLIISEWVGALSGGERANGIIFGIIVAILAATRFTESSRPWASWLNALIGIWVILQPWVYGYSGDAWMWNAIVVGIIMLVLGVWSAVAGSTDSTTTLPGGAR